MVRTTVRPIFRHIVSWKPASVLLLTVCLAAGRTGLTHHAEAAKQTPASESAKTRSAARTAERQEEKVRTDRYGDPLPEGALARLGTTRLRQGFSTLRVAFSPDGKTIACSGTPRGVCLWDTATGKQLRQVGQETQGHSVCFSPDGKVLACCASSVHGCRATLYETATGRAIVDLPHNVRTLMYAPNGKMLAATIESGNAIHLFDAVSGEKLKKEAASGTEKVERLAWSPNSKTIAWVGQTGFIHLWDADKGAEIAQWKGRSEIISALAFAPDGKTLAAGSSDQIIRLWDVVTHEEKHVLNGRHQQVQTVAFSRDGRMLASGHRGGTIALWDAAKGTELRSWPTRPFICVTSLDFSPDGKTLVSAGVWQTGPRLWGVGTGMELRPIAGHTAPVEQVVFSPDGEHLLSRGSDKMIWEWDLANGRGKECFRTFSAVPGRSGDLEMLSPRGDVVANYAREDNTLRLWGAGSAKESRPLAKFGDRRINGGINSALVFSPDGRFLAFDRPLVFPGGRVQVSVVVWDTATGAARQQIKGFDGEVDSLAFSPDGKRLTVASSPSGMEEKATISLWDVDGGEELVKFSCTGPMNHLAFSPDGKILASASSWLNKDSSVSRLWDAESGRELRPLDGTPRLYSLAFSADGKWLAGAGVDRDHKVYIWEINTGLKVRTFPGHDAGRIWSVAFAPDGRTLASGAVDSTTLLWDFTDRMKEGRLQAAKWKPRELEKRWIDLGSNAGPQAVQAIWDLVASPDQSVPLLRQRIKPVEPVDVKRVERWIADLDSDDFPTRAKATKELNAIVEGAAPALRKRLTEKPPLEMRQRIKQILGTLDPSADTERLRALRAIQVLEYIGTLEAREHLRAVAKGVAEAQLTRDAKAALVRLAK